MLGEHRIVKQELLKLRNRKNNVIARPFNRYKEDIIWFLV